MTQKDSFHTKGEYKIQSFRSYDGKVGISCHLPGGMHGKTRQSDGRAAKLRLSSTSRGGY